MARRLNHRDNVSDLGIDVYITDLQKVRDYIAAYPERVTQSARRSANKTANAIRNQSFKVIAKDYTVKQKNLKASIHSVGYRGGAGYAAVNYSAKKVEAQYFKYSPKRIGIRKKGQKGISIQLRKGEAMKEREGSFLAHAQNGLIKIFRRKYYKQDKGRIGVKVRRLPIMREFGPSVASMIKKESIPYLKEYGEQRYMNEFIHEMTEGYQYKFKRRY